MTPESVGWASRRIVVTKLSGRHGLAARFAELGIQMDRDSLGRAYDIAMREGSGSREIDDRTLIAIAAEARRAGVPAGGATVAPAVSLGD
jgi:isopropylmalate/homocitrate/citramalate synthase